MNRDEATAALIAHPDTGNTFDQLEHLAGINLAVSMYGHVFGYDNEQREGEPRAALIRARLVSVDIIERADGAITKSRLTLQADNEDDHETIDSDPLHDEWARHLHAKATGLVGDRVIVIKRNTIDPTGKTPAGYRRYIWIHPEPTGTTGF